MESIQVFSNPEFGDVRMIIINGEPWFVAKDIAEKLGYAKTFSMTKQIDKDDKQIFDCSSQEDTSFSVKARKIGIINESGLYSAIMGSQLKTAKAFKRWVTKDILPSIRKTGAYGQPKLPDNPMELLKIHYAALEQVDKKVSDMGSKVETLEERFNKFEQELPMLPDDADEVHDSLNKKVISLLGGKSSNAYKDKSLSKKVFMDAYRSLKYNFNVSRYKAIKRNQKAQALKIIAEYKPPFYLTEQIEAENAQQSFNFESEGLHGK